MLGWLIIFDGFAQLVYAFQSEGVGRITWKIMVAVLYLAGGAYLLAHTELGIAGLALVLVLAIIFFVEGFMDLTAYFVTRRNDRSVWLLLHGIASVFLGLSIWRQWPTGSSGTIVGISMFLSGICRLLMALEAEESQRRSGL
jgi:uncharacterized membrane protein HdeD (DUF308 family)